MMKRLFLSLFLLPLLACAAETLTFNDLTTFTNKDLKETTLALKPWNGKKITIRGFIYQTDEKKWVISCDPNVPSCCRKGPFLTHQIFLHGNLEGDKNVQIANVEGVFSVEAVSDSNGKVQELFHMTDPLIEQIEKTDHTYLLITLSGLALLIIILFLRKRIRYS